VQRVAVFFALQLGGQWAAQRFSNNRYVVFMSRTSFAIVLLFWSAELRCKGFSYLFPVSK